jgi:hypothetical protein
LLSTAEQFTVTGNSGSVTLTLADVCALVDGIAAEASIDAVIAMSF